MIVAVIILAFVTAVLVVGICTALTLGLVEWSSSENQMSHYFVGPTRRGVTVENIPCRCIEIVFGRICIDINIGRWT